MTLRVIWEIDVEADSPQEAAENALEVQRNPDSIATVFDVVDEAGTRTRVDLDAGSGRTEGGQ